uniref:Pectinesterase inhibitor domain-containing protein n=1 Tax=Cannabis sativa TaxID=3483 RepID=A0A803NW68_CANSA
MTLPLIIFIKPSLYLFLFITSTATATATSPLDPNCNSSLYPKLCRSILSSITQYTPADPYTYGKFSVKQCLKKARRMTRATNRFLRRHRNSISRRDAGAVEDCRQLFELNVEFLESISENLRSAEFPTSEEVVEQVRSRLSAIVTNQETCYEGLVEAKSGVLVGRSIGNGTVVVLSEPVMFEVSELYSVSLGLVMHALSRNIAKHHHRQKGRHDYRFPHREANPRRREPLAQLIKVRNDVVFVIQSPSSGPVWAVRSMTEDAPYVRPFLAMGSRPLPTDTSPCVLGFNTLPLLDLSKVSVVFCCSHLSLFREKVTIPALPGFFCVCGISSGLLSGISIMAALNIAPLVDEITQETENFCLDDFSIEVTPDNDLAKETIAHSMVGKFYSKKPVSNGTLRKALSGLWKLNPGWRFQTVKPRTFIFRLGSSKEVKYVLDNGPWNLCSGYLLVAALPEDGKWESADLSCLDIWVKARGVPLPFMTEACIQQMAGRMGKLLQANKVRKNGVIMNDFLRFQVRLNLAVPLLAGVSLPEYGQKKVWSLFKYEKLPIFCFKCGVMIGHVETDCSGKKCMVTVQDGRNIPLFGSWLRDGSRLENGFALLEVESLHDRNRLENFDPVLDEMPLKDGREQDTPGMVVANSGSHTRVERDKMEGVVSQRADNSFNVAYNDYVDTSKFPSQHVVHVAKLFQEKLGPIKFGANREDGEKGKDHSGKIKKLKKSKVVGPRGIPKIPIFGKSIPEPGSRAGSKRKKVEADREFESKFTDESRGNSCLIIVEKTGVKDVFAETSGVNVPGDSDNLEDSGYQAKRARMFLDSLRSVEGSFEGIKDGDDGRALISGPERAPVVQMGQAERGFESLESDARATKSDASVTYRVGKQGLGSPSAKKALRALVTREDPDVLFLMETKLSGSRMNGVWRNLGFGGASVVEAVGSAGGTCLCWKAGLDVQVMSENVGVTNAVFSNILNGPVWHCLFFYGPPSRAARREFWEERTLEVLALNHPWLLMGDLNTILGQHDKVGGREVEESDASDLNDLLDSTGGVDLGCVGNHFTWTNGRCFQDLIKERLDRALCDPEWMMSYPKAGVRALAIKDSDHAPLVVDLLFDRERFHTPFRYLDAWSRDEGCKAVIQQAWAIDVRGTVSLQLVTRLDNTRRCLAKWNKTHFGMCKEKIKTLNNFLVEVQRRMPSKDNLKLEADILLELDEVETRYAEIWKQKSRELWYRDGDRNSKFFHAATVIKRKRNFINVVRVNDTEWIEGRQQVGEYFWSNFMSILSSVSPADPLLDDLVSRSISEDANQKDGTKDFRSIGEAIAIAPKNLKAEDGYFIIYAMEGYYEEYIVIPRCKKNIMLLGDGINSTIVSGNHSVIDGWSTYNSSTFAVAGDHFMAIDITFRNTAGPEKHQAVAVRNQADLSIFYRCSIEGYQDTLYVHSLRQFYRDCQIQGTVDFIFGNAAAVFQNCKILARKPMLHQKNVITAQGRTDPNQNTGISIHNCTIEAAPDLAVDVDDEESNTTSTTTLSYLGRPWKQYSRTVYMQSYIGSFVTLVGWLEWNGTLGLDTLFYGEFENYGPGSDTGMRVKWPGFVLMNTTQALNFTLYNFTMGETWLPDTDIPFAEGLLD